MRFTLNVPEPQHGIKVIRDIPDISLCRIEGLNGIGKTLAVHLLEICAGVQPYTTLPRAWRSLCKYLGPAEVLVEGLRPLGDRAGEPGHTLRFEIDWRERDDEFAPREITADLFHGISLDGRPLDDMREVRRWFSVVRIAGNQNLTDTIAGIVGRDVEMLDAAASVARGRTAFADSMLSRLLEPFSFDHAVRALLAAEELDGVAARKTELQEEKRDMSSRLEPLEGAASTRALIRDVSVSAGVLKEQIENLKSQAEAARKRSEQASAELDDAKERQRLSKKAEADLKKAESLFSRRLNALQRAEADAERQAAKVSLPADADRVQAAIADLAAERAEISRQRDEAQDQFAIRDVLDGLVNALAPAATGGLRSRTIAVVEGMDLTAGDLLDAVRTRRDQFLAEAPAVENLDQRLADLQVKERELAKLAELVQKRLDKKGSLDEAEEELDALSQPGDASKTVAEKSSAKAAAQRVEVEVGSALGATERQLAQLGGGASAEDLQSEFDRQLVEANVSPDDLDDELDKLRRDFRVLADELDATLVREAELSSQVQELHRNLAKQAEELAVADAHSTLRQILGNAAPDPSADPVDLARAWKHLHEANDRAVQRLQGARSSLDQLSTAIHDLLDAIDQRNQPPPSLDVLRSLYEDLVKDRFSQPEVLAALFDKGAISRIDLATGEIAWKTGEGDPRVRPFEAFSSGERAFAYVEARLAAAEHQHAANRLVAVDEFGAFLSRDRLIRLQNAVTRQLQTGAIDQVLVVLPLSSADDEQALGGAGYVADEFDALATA
jgi:hypothetical protein